MSCFTQSSRRRPLWSLFRVLLLFAAYGFLLVPYASRAPGEAQGTEKLPVLFTAAAVRNLSSAQAEAGQAVRLAAVVTFYDRQTDYLFVQDRTAGIFVQ